MSRTDVWKTDDEHGTKKAHVEVYQPGEVKVKGVMNLRDVIVVDKELFYQILGKNGFTQVGKHAPE